MTDKNNYEHVQLRIASLRPRAGDIKRMRNVQLISSEGAFGSESLVSIVPNTMAECSQKSTSGSIRMFVVNSKVYVRDPDTSLHGREKRTDLKEEEEFCAVAVQESDPTVSLWKDKSEMAVFNYPKNSF